ncbi:MAG: DUF5329 family protein [Deltaproteobacteria bacterium]|nr:DUF5329 family protein [Deltaproteobacteria bacterium]MBT4263158.1 DUF5329 family protein [Deltaproteobacteria bacterium]MBT4641951.1 DUF5329 family protein [Deltaproteobacteria bacterium]MBT6613354.1 DUF5329 family protein [Deltaproteobacteria bacterium]MBT7155395.1 DUF5329 family protein [Deltaproteobacteria bacterium]
MKKGLILFLIFFALPLMGDWQFEKERIGFLLNQISRVDGVFIRNGVAHTPEKAVAHLELKMKNALNSWFSPDKEKWTAEMFIEKLASKSSLTGNPYLIKFSDGRTVWAGEWLLESLARYD